MDLFILLNYFFCLVTSFSLFILILQYRFLVIKPSIIVILFFHLMIQWAATISSGHIESYLPDPIAFAFLVHGFPLIGLSVSFFTQSKNTKIVWYRLTDPNYFSYKLDYRVILTLAGLVTFIGILYLTYIPFEQTGLFAIFTNPKMSAIVRENSLKLIDSEFIKYSYSFMIFALAPLLSVTVAILLVQSIMRKQIFQILLTIIAIAFILFLVSLTGERSPAAFIILTIFFALLLNQGLPINRRFTTLAVLATLTGLAIPTLLTILREGKVVSIPLLVKYLTTGIFGRIFYLPMKVGLDYVHYAQTEHFFGIVGIPKLAILFGIEPFDIANFIGIKYEFEGIQSVTANACYVLTYYSYFGLFSLILSLLGLWLLDYTIWIYRRLSNNLLLPCVASISIVSIYFTSGDYTTVLLTGGFGVILIVACTLDLLCFNSK